MTGPNLRPVIFVTHLSGWRMAALDMPVAGHQTARPRDGEFVGPLVKNYVGSVDRTDG